MEQLSSDFPIWRPPIMSNPDYGARTIFFVFLKLDNETIVDFDESRRFPELGASWAGAIPRPQAISSPSGTSRGMSQVEHASAVVDGLVRRCGRDWRGASCPDFATGTAWDVGISVVWRSRVMQVSRWVGSMAEENLDTSLGTRSLVIKLLEPKGVRCQSPVDAVVAIHGAAFRRDMADIDAAALAAAGVRQACRGLLSASGSSIASPAWPPDADSRAQGHP